MTKLDEEVREWMLSLGFQDNTEAEMPNYTYSLGQFVEPNEIVQQVALDSPDWNPLDDVAFISPELAKLFYLACKKGV